MIKKIFKYFGLAVVALVAVLLVKTLLYQSKQPDVAYKGPVGISEMSITNLSNAIQFMTVSNEDPSLNDTSEFALFHEFLRKAYPLAHQTLKKGIHNKFALLYEWEGKDTTLKPVILLAHQDVVPVVEAEWERPPFSGLIEDGYVWGRGTLDDKGSMIAIFESVEKLIREGFVPNRTVFLAFGDDEEVGGKGAMAIANSLKERGVDAEMVIDEGMVITSGIVPMVSKPVAIIGTAEKGYLSVKLSCNVDGGHSSMPQAETAISILSNALVKITNNRPSPTFTKPVKEFLRYIGPEIPWPARIVFANRWLLGGVLKSIYTGSGPGNATVRTTTAPTMFESGIKDNVLPTSATAIVNFRLLPGDPSAEILSNLKKIIDDNRVSIEALEGVREPTPVSPAGSNAFKVIQKTIKQSFDNTIVAPTLMLGASDSRNYIEISKNIYRFAPYQLNPEMLETLHGNNERISVDNFKAMVGFYWRLIKNAQSK